MMAHMQQQKSVGLVIFDLDGTLIDTVPLITRCFQKVFRKYGHRELTDEQVHAMFGPGESVIFAREFGDRWPEILADYLECYQAGHDTVTLSPEIVGVLDGIDDWRHFRRNSHFRDDHW